jgi:hypothetical protein
VATLTVEGIPSGLLLRLAAAAAANGRCLNSEVIVHLARSAGARAMPGVRPARESAAPGCMNGRACRCRRWAEGAGDRAGWGGPAAR